MLKFIDRLAKDGLPARCSPRERNIFRLNNIHFILNQIQNMHIFEHGINDMEALQKIFDNEIEEHTKAVAKE